MKENPTGTSKITTLGTLAVFGIGAFWLKRNIESSIKSWPVVGGSVDRVVSIPTTLLGVSLANIAAPESVKGTVFLGGVLGIVASEIFGKPTNKTESQENEGYFQNLPAQVITAEGWADADFNTYANAEMSNEAKVRVLEFLQDQLPDSPIRDGFRSVQSEKWVNDFWSGTVTNSAMYNEYVDIWPFSPNTFANFMRYAYGYNREATHLPEYARTPTNIANAIKDQAIETMLIVTGNPYLTDPYMENRAHAISSGGWKLYQHPFYDYLEQKYSLDLRKMDSVRSYKIEDFMKHLDTIAGITKIPSSTLENEYIYFAQMQNAPSSTDVAW